MIFFIRSYIASSHPCTSCQSGSSSSSAPSPSLRPDLSPGFRVSRSIYALQSTTMGLRGHALSLAQLFLVVAPSFILFGYNQAGVGGLLSLHDWIAQFPSIDTTTTTGAVKSHNATIQGVVVATFVLGALVGALSCMIIGDIFGRRKWYFALLVGCMRLD